MNLFCFGLGYVANYIEKNLPNVQVSGTHRDHNKIGVDEYLFNENQDPPVSSFENATHILISIPPTSEGDPVYLRLISQIRNLKNLKWIGYISSTSVYGNHNGNWVTEESETIPVDKQGKNRLIAEKQWLSTNLPVVIIRMSAIYGKKRSIIDFLLEGKVTKINMPGHYFSRIYIKDIAKIIITMMHNYKSLGIYNLVDDFPSSQAELISFASNLLKLDEPLAVDFKDANISEGMKKFYLSNKRVSNLKVKKEFNITLSYPSFKEGLLDIINCE